MTKTIIFLFLLNVGIIVAQPQLIIPVDTNNVITYEGIIEMPNYGKKKLTSKISEFLYLKSPSAEFRIFEGEINKIFFTGNYGIKRHKGGKNDDLFYILKFYIKENRVKYQLTDFVVSIHSQGQSIVTQSFFGVGKPLQIEGKKFQHNLEKWNTPEIVNGKNSMFIEIDKTNRIIIEEFKRYLTTDLSDSDF